MDVLSWILWFALSALSLLWSVAWFLIGGWVSTLAQIVVIIGVIYILKYGWRRAPYEIANRTASFGRFFWGWLRAREPATGGVEVREVVRFVRAKELGDINVSTLLNLATLAGLALVSAGAAGH